MSSREEGPRKPRPLSGSASAVASLLGRSGPGRLLDCPCGEGWLAAHLAEAGFEVELADIAPEPARSHGFECAAVDLNRDELPYPEASFDYVACAGGLHRLYHVRRALDEFHRVLAPGGKLVVGTINYGSLVRRLGFLLAGRLGRRIARLPSRDLGGEPAGSFRTALTCRELVMAVEAAGFEVRRVSPTRLSLRAVALLPLALAVWLAGRLLFRPGEPLGTLLGGRHALVVAEKRPREDLRP